jgi:hypothetical protein
MYSIGQTAVASMPPATHPAESASIGCFFLLLLLLLMVSVAEKGLWIEPLFEVRDIRPPDERSTFTAGSNLR